jgi:hypothetical protein
MKKNIDSLGKNTITKVRKTVPINKFYKETLE